MKIIIGGDIVPTESNEELFLKGDIYSLIGKELKSILDEADVRVFNLEAPILNYDAPNVKKAGVRLRINEECLKGIKALNPTVLTLANNHIMDQGQTGLNNTVEILRHNNIAYVGVGNDIQEASEVFFIKDKEFVVGIYACTEHEFSCAESYSTMKCGANPFEPLDIINHIENAKKQCDYLIVLYHGGKEFYRYPSPNLQKVFRKLAQNGADLIVAQHTHCIGSVEKYMGATLIYGQGNFIFDRVDDEFWNTGMLIGIELNEGNQNIEYIPYQKTNGRICALDKPYKEKVLDDFYNRSNNVTDELFIKKKYELLARSEYEKYMKTLHGQNIVFLAINKLTKGRFLRYMYKKDYQKLAVLNYIECEAHRELIITALRDVLDL